MYIFVAVAVVAVAIVTALTMAFSRARVTGDTPDERIASISRLAARAPLGAGQAIAGAATDDPDPKVRQVAMVSLGRFVDPSIRPAVEAGARDADAGVRQAAADALALYDDAPAAGRLADMAENDSADEVRLRALQAMGRCSAPEAVVTLVEAMETGAEDKQARAVHVLARKYSINARALTPANRKQWLHIIEVIKKAPGVDEAFRRLARPLVRHPENLIPDPPEH